MYTGLEYMYYAAASLWISLKLHKISVLGLNKLISRSEFIKTMHHQFLAVSIFTATIRNLKEFLLLCRTVSTYAGDYQHIGRIRMMFSYFSTHEWRDRLRRL